MKLVHPLAALAAVLAVPAAAQGPSPDGLWINPHRTVAVRTGPCGQRLCGWVAWASPQALADARDGGVTHLIGTALLEDYQPDGPGAWSGTVYVPDDDKRYSSEITQRGPAALKIKGCILGGLICKSQVWTRIERLPQ